MCALVLYTIQENIQPYSLAFVERLANGTAMVEFSRKKKWVKPGERKRVRFAGVATLLQSTSSIDVCLQHIIIYSHVMLL